MKKIELKRPELEDRALINRYLEYTDTRSCDMTFANVYLWSRHYATGFAIVEDMLVFGSWEEPGYYTVPVGPGDLRGSIEALRAACREEGVPFHLYIVTPEDYARLEELYPGELSIAYDPDIADYVYETEKLQTLSGKKYHSKKNHVNKFMNLYPDWSYEPISQANVEECFHMAQRWRQLNGCEEDEEKNAELCVTMNFLRLFDELEMKGGLLRVGGRVVAFTIGEPVGNRQDTLVVHIEKAYADIQGAYTMINQQFAIHEGGGYLYMNREEDMGEEGLRQAKQSYKPVFMVEKGVVTWVND